MTSNPPTVEPAYPGGDLTFYGVTGALYYEDGGVVFGHGRRALAAANALGRYEGGSGWYRPYGTHKPTVEELWATFAETCGCTPEEHAADDHDCDMACEYSGLPPCGDDYCWLVQTSVDRRPGDLPIVEVKW